MKNILFLLMLTICVTTASGQNGLPAEVMVPPGYYTYEQIVSIADSLVTAFPSICKKISWGTSVGGRQLAALKISKNVDMDEAEPEIMFDGGIHGDEVGTSQNLIWFARELCSGYGTNSEYTALINSHEIWIYYMVNPDGRVNMSRVNQNMVDLNRDFGYMWNGEGNSPAPFSQPESKALRDCILENQFTIYTNYHSGSEIIAYPWGYRPDSPADYGNFNYLAEIYADSSGYQNLFYGQSNTNLYPVSGSSKDFLYGVTGNVAWSIEISIDKQPPPPQNLLFYNDNLPAMIEMIRRSGYGMKGMITDSCSGTPVKSTVWISNYYPVNNDPVVGDYHKFTVPGPNSVKVVANGYKTKTLDLIYVHDTGAATANFQLNPDPHWYASRVISCVIPGNNFDDPGFTPGALGAPDTVPYCLGKNGYIILDMGDTIFNRAGSDLKVFEAGNGSKGYLCYASISIDGPWKNLGAANGNCEFDLTAGPLPKARYIKILDDGNGPSTGLGAGFDLDAVEMLSLPVTAQFNVSNNNFCEGNTVSFTDQSTGNPTSWNWTFDGGSPATSIEQNPPDIAYYNPGNYNVTLTVSDGTSTNTRTNIHYLHIMGPLVNLGNDTTVYAGSTVIIDAGNPGCTYLWSTGDTTQLISVDSSGVGLNSHTYSVTVTDSMNCSGYDEKMITWSTTIGYPDPLQNQSITVYPNPASGNVHIQLQGLEGRFRILSMMGITALSGIIHSSESYISIDLSGIHAGLYFVEISQGSVIYIKKLIIN
ncbi:MAG: M14 family zinc carboxypeptidase [Bacteroidetes bacterium]|nr:M14 family zinc carboxypeptidase [Bacteroidota bacterium]